MTTTAPSPQDFFDIGRAALQIRNPNLKVVEGDVTDAILWGAAAMASSLVSYFGARVAATFLDGAFGNDLKDLALDRGVAKDLGDAAVGAVVVSRISFSLGAGVVPAGTRIATNADNTGKFATFTTDVDAVFGSTDLTKTINATCTKLGRDGNASTGSVVRILDSLFDPTITVANPTKFAGGMPAEDDPELRDRVRRFFLTEARGTVDALIYGAKTVPGVRRASVIVDYVTGIVTLYVSDADGNANTALTDATQAEIIHWADAGDVVNVVGATLYIQSVDVSLTVRTGVDVAALEDRVRAAIISRVGRLSPGETLYRDMISAAVRDVDKDNILTVIVNTPAANITPTSSQVIRTDNNHVVFS